MAGQAVTKAQPRFQPAAPDTAFICNHLNVSRQSFSHLLNEVVTADKQPVADVLNALRGQQIYGPKRPANGVFIINEGAIRLFRMMADGRRAIIRFLFPGDLLWVGSNDLQAFEAEAVIDSHLSWFAGDIINKLMHEAPQIRAFLLDHITEDLRCLQNQLVTLGRKSAVERVAFFLTMLAARQCQRGMPIDPVLLPMSRSEIADFLGLTTETVSRSFSQLKAIGNISVQDQGAVHIHDVERLANLADGL